MLVSAEVWKRSRQSGSALLLLLALADYADDAALAWPRVETLAAKARLRERHARRLLRQLEEAGEISIEVDPDDRRRRVYRLDPYRPGASGDTGPGGSDTGLGEPVSGERNRSPETGKYRSPRGNEYRSSRVRPSKEEPSGEPSREPPPSTGSARVERVLAHWLGLPTEVERPSGGKVRRWLRDWSDDEGLDAELARLRSRGSLVHPVNYVDTCLTSARHRRRLGTPAPAGDLVAEMQAIARRDPAPPPLDVAAHLGRLADGLPEGLAERERWVDRIRGLEGEVAEVEESLAGLERELLERLDEGLDEFSRRRLEARVEGAMRRIGDRLDGSAARQAAAGLRRRLLRREAGVPSLSLFSPVAEGSGPAGVGAGDV